jgi:imidazolonepropionase-like amidohydrolase
MLAIRDGTVVDADGSRRADVGIEDGRIVSVGDVGDAEEEIDAEGRYVAPGLIDAHVHLSFDARPDPSTTRQEAQTLLAMRATANLEAALAAGVTTVRDLGSPGTLSIDARRAVEEGVVPGPRVVPAGENVVMTGGHGHWFGREADGPAEVRKAVREQLKKGADVIKCMATGGVLTEGASSRPWSTRRTPRASPRRPTATAPRASRTPSGRGSTRSSTARSWTPRPPS